MAHNYYRYTKFRSGDNGGIFAALVLLGIVALFLGIKAELWPTIISWTFRIITALLLGGLAWAVYFDFKNWQREQSFKLAEVDAMTGLEFEHYLQGLLRSRGLTNVSVTQKLGKLQADYGIDLLGTHAGIKYAIQAKRYATHNLVGVEAVREAHTGATYYHCQKGMVITSGYFSYQAEGLADSAGVYLVNRDKLAEWIEDFQGLELGVAEYFRARIGKYIPL